QMLAEDRMLLVDLRDGGRDRARDVDPGALGGGAGAPMAPPEPDRMCELLREGVDLGLQPLDATEVAPPAGLLELLLQLGEPALVGDARLRVDHLARVAVRRTYGLPAPAAPADPVGLRQAVAGEVEDVDLLTGTLQESRQVGDALRVPDADGG